MRALLSYLLPSKAILLVAAFSLAGWAFGQDTVSSPPMGYVKIALHGRTDNLINIPLLQEPIGIGPVLAVTSNTVSLGNANWTTNEFAPATTYPGVSYYAEISTGELQGLCYPIVSNTTDTLVLNTGGDDLTAHTLGAVAVNNMIRIRPYWTIGAVFGATDSTVSLNPFATLPSAQLADSGDSLLFFAAEAIGLQKAPETRYAYVQSTGWRLLSDGATDQENTVIPPLSPVLVRMHETSGQQLVLLGDAFQSPATIYVPGGNGQLANDAFIALASSEPVALANTGLYSATSSQNVVTATTQSNQRQDLLLVFDPTRKGYERPPEHTYFYLTGQGWSEVGSSSTTVGTDVQLDPTRIYILRKRAASGGQYWLQNGSLP